MRQELFTPLDQNLGTELSTPWYRPPDDYEARRFDVDNGDTALFAWTDGDAYWLGNTETPSVLWRTEKYAFEEVPAPIARWAQRELLAELIDQEPWLADAEDLSRFFLPVLCSKDGRHTSRAFFKDHAAGFPDATREDALAFYDAFLSTGTLDDYRYTMAAKLGTSERADVVRMSATMSEFTVAKLLTDAGYDVTPEIEVTTGHSLDFRAERTRAGGDAETALVEVTRPRPPTRRAANTPVAAVRDTSETKTSGQLSQHGGGVVLVVDCSSFRDDEWAQVRGERPEVRHRPAVVVRARPDGSVEAYRKGTVPLELDDAVTWVDGR